VCGLDGGRPLKGPIRVLSSLLLWSSTRFGSYNSCMYSLLGLVPLQMIYVCVNCWVVQAF
jgi:hypothetical protein